MELQQKIEDTELFNFHIPELEDAFLRDKLFIGRFDCVNDLNLEIFQVWLDNLAFKSYLLCKENGTETQKEHVHFVSIIPDTLTYKSVSDYFVKQIVKKYNLEKHQFSKKKNGAKHHITTNLEFKKILSNYNMEWFDYAACYYCKDDGYIINTLNISTNELKSRYDVIHSALNKLPKKKSNQNMISLLIERWTSIHQELVNPNLSIVEPEYVKKLQEFIIDEISKNNKGNKMAHLFNFCRLKQYTQTILYTLNPEFAKRRMMYDYDTIVNIYL